MTTLYKLTDENGYTRAGYNSACLWGDGISHSGTGEGRLCGPGWVHAYEHPLLAVVLNPIHADIANPRLWVAEGEIAKRNGQLKVGCATLTTVKEIPLPVISTAACVRFAALCAKAVCTEPSWEAWADGWLSGEDRTAKAAWAAAAARVAAAAAARQAWAAAEAAGVPIDLIALLKQAIRDEADFEAASVKA